MALKSKTRISCPQKSLCDNGTTDMWTLSTLGAGIYYYNVGDILNKPLNVLAEGAELTLHDDLATITAGQWSWGNLDSLLGDVLYIRLLSGDTDPDLQVADSIKCSELLEIFQATTALETISLAMIISNNETVDNAKVVMVVSSSSDVAKFVMMFNLLAADGPLTLPDKLVLDATDKLSILTDKEMVSVIISEDESQ